MKKVLATVCMVLCLTFGGGVGGGCSSSNSDPVGEIIEVVFWLWLFTLPFCEEAQESEFPQTTKLMILEGGKAKLWLDDDEKSRPCSWAIEDRKLKLTTPDSGNFIFEFRSDSAMRCVEATKSGKLTAIPLKMQYTLRGSGKKIAFQNN